jgi:hypothetical protein
MGVHQTEKTGQEFAKNTSSNADAVARRRRRHVWKIGRYGLRDRS